MPTELIDALRALAGEWEAAAPAVTMTDLTQERAITDEAPPTSSVIAVATPTRSRRGWLVAACVAAAAVLVIVAVAVTNNDEPNRRIEPPVDSGIPVTSTTAAATTATTVPPTVQQQLDDILGTANEALSRLKSFSATATVTRGGPIIGPTATDVRIEEHTSVNRVTLMADGSLWTEGDTTPWSSYDASTGVARAARLAADGTIAYQEVVGWADNSVPLNILFGADPVPSWPLFESAVEQGMELTVSEVDSHLGRPAWRIDAVNPGGADDGTESWMIDRTTGLVVEHHIRQPASFGEQNVGEDSTDIVLDDLVTDVELPAAFPGTFPDGAVVDRSGDPNGFQLVTLDQAAQIFGSPIAVPADLPADARVRAMTQRQSYGPPEPNATYFEVTIEFGEGFIRTRVMTSKSVLDPGQPVPTGSLVVDGLLCSTVDGVHCTEWEIANDVGTGAFEGLPMTVSNTMVDIVDGGLLIRVNGADEARTTTTAASLTLVGP
jgi:hypothetical protein